MKQYLIKMIKAGIPFEIHETEWNKNNKKFLFGLKWGGGKIARIMGFKRRDVIESLKWADKNPDEALKLFNL